MNSASISLRHFLLYLIKTNYAMGITGKDVQVLIAAFLAIIYLLNPTAGIFEIIPDNLPIIGNLDELGASMILISAVQYFLGDNVGRFFQKRDVNITVENPNEDDVKK